MKTRLTSVTYLGFTAMDRRFSNAMLPWLLREIRTTGVAEKLSIAVEEGCLKAYNGNFEPVIIHRLVDIIRASQVPGRPDELFYILLNEKESLLNCYLFRANSAAEVAELFTQMREPSPGSGGGSTVSLAVTRNAGFQQTGSADHLPWAAPPTPVPCNAALTNESQPPGGLVRSISNASALTSLSADLSPSDSHFFEVLYIGKVRISQRKVPESLIDDALHKFAQHEAEKLRANAQRRHSLLSSTATSVYSNNSTESLEKSENLDCTNKRVSFSTSTTPLEPDKHNWKSIDNLEDKSDEKSNVSTNNASKENTTIVKNNNNINEKSKNDVDQEFDMFTKERVEKNGKKSSQVPLEPNVLILNVPKKNLGTVAEERNEELHNFIKETASSITEFCQTNFYKAEEAKDISKENNPFLFKTDVAKYEEEKIKDLKDPLMNILVRSESEVKESSKSDSQIELSKNSKRNLENTEPKADIKMDSPRPMSFDEISRKPRNLPSNDNERRNSMPENKPFLRDRSASIGTLNLKTPITQLIGEQNRTMLFQVGRSELRLISPDRKQILLHRAFKDVASCVLGRLNKEHFGFVCRESVSDTYACYVFKCESDSVATEVVNAIKQAFVAHAELIKKSREKSPNMTCEHCPMLWYHRLCHDVEGMNEKKTHAFILRRIEQLPEDEQDVIITKYQGGTNHMYEVSEHNAFLMMLLRAHCEAKQQRHVHDTAENRSEFLNQYLGGSTIFMKAKRSLSSGFDHLLKRRASRDDGHTPQMIKKDSSPFPTQGDTTISSESTENRPVDSMAPDSARKSVSPGNGDDPSSPEVPSAAEEEAENSNSKEDVFTPPVTSPMMDIFLKVSDNRPTVGGPGTESDATWRQAIYEKAVQAPEEDGELIPKGLLGVPPATKRSKQQLRQLWKLAIDQTLLLVRMEKENARLREREESSAVRRIKLEYSELGVCDAGASLMWDTLLATKGSQPPSKVDRHMLTQAVIQGVPRMSRGGVWYFLAEQHCLRAPPPDTKQHPQYHTPYRTLLAGLTKHQHAILIDLGRTFPKHSYFASALGPGQLALYNILKAYSLLDPDVGYCQGLSFVAGVLLLHMEEAEAFILLRHLMFRRGLRKQYLPDMSALQVQLYQLSRLLRDHEPELHAKLESLDISPALYAAPWMLTLFTSQFPLGFVVRVFDLIFLDSLEVVFAVSLALLSEHRAGLLLCESCEEAAEYLRHKLPDMPPHMYEKVMKKVLSLDISRQLSDYAVEYAVLREEMPRLAALTEDNRLLSADKTRLSEELDSAMDAINSYQKTQARLESQNKMMEQQLTLLSRYITAHQKQDMPVEIKKIVQNYSKKLSFSSKILKFTSIDDDEKEDPRKNFKTGASTPNLFAKISKDELINSVNRERNKSSIENDRRHFMMKKSQSVHSGLIANNLRQYPLKALEEMDEIKRSDSLNHDMLKESLKELGKKNSGFFANTHEQIRQERMFEKQLKQDFDENLKKLDEKLQTKAYLEDLSIFQGRKCMSLNIHSRFDKLDRIDSEETIDTSSIDKIGRTHDKCIRNDKADNIESNTEKIDSGFVTPQSPNDKIDKDDNCSDISHPLSDIDAAIKFDGQSTKLKQIRPIRSSLDHK